MWNNANAGSQRFADAAIFENNGNVFLQLIGASWGERSLNFGHPDNGADGAIKYNFSSVPSGFSFWTGGNNFRVAIDASGRVGIGRATPDTMLHLDSGAIKIGGFVVADSGGSFYAP
jgi:hypothetical protein